MTRGAVIALSHGGGPMPLLGDPKHAEIVDSLRFKVPRILRLDTPEAPRAIVLVTAHWSERNPTITNSMQPKLLYDYYNFPPESYKLKYDASGSPELAEEIAESIREVGLEPEYDDVRGWDHGVFVPMLLINPKANIPIVQMSVLDSEDPEDHFKMGKALEKLRDDNVAIIGSGFASFHNLPIFFGKSMESVEFRERNNEWSDALHNAVEQENPAERFEKLKGWRSFPHAYESHPRGGAEHFLPLVVIAGAGGQGKPKKYADEYRGIKMYSYYWD